MLRRTKKDCLQELPPKTRVKRKVDITLTAAKQMKGEISTILAEYKARVQGGEVEGGAQAIVALNAIRKVGEKHKVPAALELVEELLAQQQQIVIFCCYLESVEILYKALKPHGCELFIGKTPVKERQEAIDRFQAGKSKIFLATISAGGVGVTLTAASNIIMLSRPYTPGDCVQAEDRCNRLGQKNPVLINWLQLTRVDQTIDESLEKKESRINLILKGKRKTMKGLTNSMQEIAKYILEEMEAE